MPARSRTCVVHRSTIHNRGLYARRELSAGEFIVEYLGERITKKESERRALAREQRGRRHGTATVYIFELNSRYDLDGDCAGNIARFANHSCEPNCEAVNDRGRIWLVARRAIAAGEELTFDYGFGLDVATDHPCRCGAPSCPGYIVNEADRPRLRKRLRQRKQRALPAA